MSATAGSGSFFQHPVTGIQHGFASSNGGRFFSVRRLEEK
jgi:hypothetical protein